MDNENEELNESSVSVSDEGGEPEMFSKEWYEAEPEKPDDGPPDTYDFCRQARIEAGEELPDPKKKLVEAGKFDELSVQVNNELAELNMLEDSAEMIGALTEIANAGNPEWRKWACGMLNWNSEMAKIAKGLQ